MKYQIFGVCVCVCVCALAHESHSVVISLLILVYRWMMLMCRQTRQRQAQAGLGARGSTFNVELTGTYKERARKTFQQYFQEINWMFSRLHRLSRCRIICAAVAVSSWVVSRSSYPRKSCARLHFSMILHGWNQDLRVSLFIFSG